MDCIVPISRFTRKRMEEEGVRGRYVVIPLGVDRSVFRPIVSPRQREVLFVGNLKTRKGLDFLIDALSLAGAQVPELRLKVVGKIERDSQAFTELSGKIAGAGIKVEFSGPLSQEQLVEAYAAARLNALPSRSEPFFFEGFGLIHLEANACGTLTVGAFDSGNEDAIQEGFGYLVRYGDVPALADAIVKAMTADPYPVLPLERLRTWDEVARDYRAILLAVSQRPPMQTTGPEMVPAKPVTDVA